MVIFMVGSIIERYSLVYGSPLGPYNISDITISGLSSGGFMTVQLHVAFSSLFKAAAVFAGVNDQS